MMDRAFKIFGAIGLSISAGAMLGMTTPTEMKMAPEAAWRTAARAANAGQIQTLQPREVVYSSMPEDLSPQIGYGNPAAYQLAYVDAPVRAGYYDAVPEYRAAPLPAAMTAAKPATPAPAPAAKAEVPAEPTKLAMVLPVDPPLPGQITLNEDYDGPAMDDITED